MQWRRGGTQSGQLAGYSNIPGETAVAPPRAGQQRWQEMRHALLEMEELIVTVAVM